MLIIFAWDMLCEKESKRSTGWSEANSDFSDRLYITKNDFLGIIWKFLSIWVYEYLLYLMIFNFLYFFIKIQSIRKFILILLFSWNWVIFREIPHLFLWFSHFLEKLKLSICNSVKMCIWGTIPELQFHKKMWIP